MSEDEPSKEELAERVGQLEQTVRKMLPTRRDVLKMGAGATVGGAAVLGTTGQAAAQASGDVADQDDSSFEVGDSSEAISGDVVVDELYDPGGDKFLNVDDTGGINAQYGRPWHFESLNTVEAVIGSGDTINQVEFGQVTISDPGASSDDTFGTVATSDQAVAFSTTFSNTPRVFAFPESGNLPGVITATGVDTTGFIIRLRNYGSFSPGDTPVSWLAIA